MAVTIATVRYLNVYRRQTIIMLWFYTKFKMGFGRENEFDLYKLYKNGCIIKFIKINM